MIWGDGSIYGDGQLYESTSDDIADFIGRVEAHSHRYSVRVKFTPSIIPGVSDAFKILNTVLRIAIDRQASFTHEAFVDKVETTNHIAIRVKHSGSDFRINHTAMVCKPRRYSNRE